MLGWGSKFKPLFFIFNLDCNQVREISLCIGGSCLEYNVQTSFAMVFECAPGFDNRITTGTRILPNWYDLRQDLPAILVQASQGVGTPCNTNPYQYFCTIFTTGIYLPNSSQKSVLSTQDQDPTQYYDYTSMTCGFWVQGYPYHANIYIHFHVQK